MLRHTDRLSLSATSSIAYASDVSKTLPSKTKPFPGKNYKLNYSNFYSAVLQRCWARVNDLSRVATRQCGGRESNPRPVDCKSSALTTTLPSHTTGNTSPRNINNKLREAAQYAPTTVRRTLQPSSSPYTPYACSAKRALRHEYSLSTGSGSLWL